MALIRGVHLANNYLGVGMTVWIIRERIRIQALTFSALTMHWSIIFHLWKWFNFPNPAVWERTFFWNCLNYNNTFFFHLPPTISHLHPVQVENCDSNSRLVLDEDDNGNYRLERVKRVGGWAQKVLFKLLAPRLSNPEYTRTSTSDGQGPFNCSI